MFTHPKTHALTRTREMTISYGGTRMNNGSQKGPRVGFYPTSYRRSLRKVLI